MTEPIHKITVSGILGGKPFRAYFVNFYDAAGFVSGEVLKAHQAGNLRPDVDRITIDDQERSKQFYWSVAADGQLHQQTAEYFQAKVPHGIIFRWYKNGYKTPKYNSFGHVKSPPEVTHWIELTPTNWLEVSQLLQKLGTPDEMVLDIYGDDVKEKQEIYGPGAGFDTSVLIHDYHISSFRL